MKTSVPTLGAFMRTGLAAVLFLGMVAAALPMQARAEENQFGGLHNSIAIDNNENGSITVCKILIDEEDNVVTGADVDAEFTIPWLEKPANLGSEWDEEQVLESAVFNTELDLNDTVLEETEDGYDAECVTYSGLSAGHYYYGEEQISGDDDDDVEFVGYHDGYNGNADSIGDVGAYDNTLFTSGDEERDQTRDGDINLGNGAERLLLVVNRLVDDGEEEDTCVLYSDTETLEGGNPAALVAGTGEQPQVNVRWTAAMNSLAKWIWGEDPIAFVGGGKNEVETFTEAFSLEEAASGAVLEIAADNGYSVELDGDPVCSDMSNGPEGSHNYQDTDECVIGALAAGLHTLEITVTNYDEGNDTAGSNPGGLRYTLTVEGSECGVPEDPEEPENTCLLPGEDGGSVEWKDVDEANLQEVLNGESYTLNADADQVNTQAWDGDNKTVYFTVENLEKLAGHNHVFGYVVDDGAFVPVFKDGEVAGYEATPLLAEDASTTFSVPDTGTTFEFAIYDGTSGMTYRTNKTENENSKDHTIVFNPSDDEYVIAFEDLASTLPWDQDYNDLVVSITVDRCSVPEKDDEATVVVTKIVCESEEYLPDWGEGDANITSTTALGFLTSVNGDLPEAEQHCWLQEGWEFEVADGDTVNPGDNIGEGGEDWDSVGFTDANGELEFEIPAGEGLTWLREVLQNGFVGFSGWLSDGENIPTLEDEFSAELYCDKDVLNYDNYDFINNPNEESTYYCVAFNALDGEPQEPGDETDVCSNLDGIQSEIPDGMHDSNGNCVKDSGRSGNRRGGGGGGNNNPQVLGAATCGPLLTQYLHIGWQNDASEVTKLQEFLNSHLGLTLPVTGFFGPDTFAAVEAFQKQYWEGVLRPWFGRSDSGISTENTPTGFVYQTTRWQINNIWCPGSEAFPESLI